MNTFILDDQGAYQPATPEQIIRQAKEILESRLYRSDSTEFTSPADVKRYLQLQLAEKEHELFAVMYLDTRHRLISYAVEFRGTIDGSSVHPREIVKAALKCNAAAVIFAHNHPSGIAEPSEADRQITERLKSALALIDVRVLDHIVVGSMHDPVSFASRGLL
jgi:DNA repair protein RadC